MNTACYLTNELEKSSASLLVPMSEVELGYGMWIHADAEDKSKLVWSMEPKGYVSRIVDADIAEHVAGDGFPVSNDLSMACSSAVDHSPITS